MSAPDSRKETPWDVLGLSPGASDPEIRAAYLEKLRQFPPDRKPQEFERIRDAYDLLRDPRRRAEALLLAVDPDEPLVALLDSLEPPRRFVGPQLWLALLKER
jgi:curved DNA-binding protein CbpA